MESSFLEIRVSDSLDLTGGFSSSLSSRLVSTWTRRCVRRLTLELKMAARLLQRRADSALSRYSLSSQDRGLDAEDSGYTGKRACVDYIDIREQDNLFRDIKKGKKRKKCFTQWRPYVQSLHRHRTVRGFRLELHRACTWQRDAVDDGGDQGLPAGSTQSFSCFSVRQEAVSKHLLVSQSAVQPEYTEIHISTTLCTHSIKRCLVTVIPAAFNVFIVVFVLGETICTFAGTAGVLTVVLME